METVCQVECVVALGNGGRQGGIEFAGGDLAGSGLGVAELAMGQVAFLSASGWAKRAAEDGAVLIEVACARVRVEDGAGFVVGEVFESFGSFFIFGEDAGGGIAGEGGGETGEGFGDSGTEASGSSGIRRGEELEASAEARGVLVGDGKDSVAALGTPRPACQVRAAAEGGGGEGSIDDAVQVH